MNRTTDGVIIPLPDVARVLVVTAHPDDLDFGAGGTIASWVDAGLNVAYCIATRGDAGGFDDTPREQMPVMREREQRAAAEVLGVTDITFLDYTDGKLAATYELRRDITREIRRFKPDRVLCQAPERNWERLAGPAHPDHIACGEATICAVYPDSRNPFAHPELLAEESLEPWTVREVWMMGGPHVNYHVDISETFDRKLAALRKHASQVSHIDNLEEAVGIWLSRQAEQVGLPPGRFAESFHVISSE